ncbi:MAG: hypothetical protein K8R99_05140 [Actinomycetia bacterium]|nr:hypothetical protein [Actinomycetes bacterium]
MSRRIDIELTSTRPDGMWTWRAAGAQQPKGVLDGSILPSNAAAGMVMKADAEFELDGITILSVSATKQKAEKSGLLAFIPSDKPFEAVMQTLAKRERGDRGPRPDRGDRPDRGPRRDRPGGPGAPGGPRTPRSPSDRRPGERTPSDRGPRPERTPSDRGQRAERGPRPERRPRFEAPPELPLRPKAKRLKPGRNHRNAALSALPEEHRAVAERALLGGIPAVRLAVNEQNERLKSEGKEQIPAAGLLAIAEQLLPKLRVAEWLDRADAAMADLEELDLRDLRSVVASSEDPMVARDETTRELAGKLKEGLVAKQEKELNLWFGDIDAALGVGRVVRALKLSSQPPKAGVRFPAELGTKLATAATGNLSTDALPERWIAVLEAVAFSPIRAQVKPTEKPAQVNDELMKTIKRVGPLLPAIAALFGVEVNAKAQPKPLRPTRATAPVKKQIPKPPTAVVAEAVAEPAAEAVAEPVVEVAEPVVEAVTEPVVEVAEIVEPAADEPIVES